MFGPSIIGRGLVHFRPYSARAFSGEASAAVPRESIDRTPRTGVILRQQVYLTLTGSEYWDVESADERLQLPFTGE